MTAGYVIRRILQLVPAVVGVVVVGFLIVHAAPGDPILALAGGDGDSAYYEAMRSRFGLDRPLLVQFGVFARNVLTGDLGTSFGQGRPVAEIIASRLPATLLLTATALVMSTVAGLGLGVFTARRQDRVADVSVNAALLTVYAAPTFWLGQLMLLVFAAGLGWFPIQGMVDVREPSVGLADVREPSVGLARIGDVAHHLVLPALALASSQVALVARLTRSALVSELASAHVRTARAKGLPERRVVYVHGLRRALLPAVTVIGGRIGHLLAGAVVVEVVFGWPGLGRLLLTAMQSRDRPVLLGLFLFVAFSVVVANLLTDLAYGWLDPRIRYTRA